MIVRCPQCEKILGLVTCGTWSISHHGREYLANEVKAVRCDACRQRWDVVTPPNGEVVLVEPKAVA